MTVFSNLDPSCKGFVTSHQVLEFCQSIYHSSISVEQIEHAITQICGSTSSGRVSRQQFIAVLEEIERRRSVEEQAYWDFQALDYKGTNRISLKDALMMFREFHGDRFSLYAWKEFLQSRDDPGEQVYFDEIRLWLCNYPSGEPASKDQITQEEEQLIKIQSRHQSDTINKLKQIQVNVLKDKCVVFTFVSACVKLRRNYNFYIMTYHYAFNCLIVKYTHNTFK